MNRLFWKYLFFLVFSVICFENFCFLEIIKPLYHRWKYKAPVFSHPSLQLQFSRYSNLPVLALTHLVFHRGLDYKSKIKSWEEKVRNNQELSREEKKVGLAVNQLLDNILSRCFTFDVYFKEPYRDRKYISLSSNILWYAFSTYALLLKSQKIKQYIHRSKNFSFFDKKIYFFVPYFYFFHPFLSVIENKFFPYTKTI